MDIKAMLDDLASLDDEISKADAERKAKRDAILALVQDQLDEVDTEYRDILGAMQSSRSKLESDIKSSVIQFGASVKATYLHAVYVKGRVTWDTKMLDGLMIAFPQLIEARKEGDPSVTIRVVKA